MLGGINLLQLEFRFFNNDYKRIRFFIIVFKFITSLLYSTGYSRALASSRLMASLLLSL